MHEAAFALWLKATLRRNRNPKWIARKLPFVRGGNGSIAGIIRTEVVGLP
jgi:hypothetical protein